MDPAYNHPRHHALNARLDAAAVPTPTLGDIVQSIASGATPRRADASLYDETDSGVNFLRILNIADGEIVETDLKRIARAVHEGALSRSQLADGDVLMTITGRVGSAAAAREEHLPANINQHIVRMKIDAERCRPDFLVEWLNCPIGTELSNRPTSGGTRPALDFQAIRRIRIPLPPLDEQDALIAMMDAARAERKAKLAEAEALLKGVDDFVMDALGITPIPEDSRRVFALRWGDLTESSLDPFHHAPRLRGFLNALRAHPSANAPLSAYAEINPQTDVSPLQPTDVVGFIPMNAVSDGASGDYEISDRPFSEVSKGYTRFADGDILWAKITPCMQNGKSCLVENLPNGVGAGSTEFHVIRVKAHGILPEFVKEFISQRSLREVAIHSFTGSAGQQRVPAEFLANLPFPAVSEQHQREIVEAIGESRRTARRLRAEAEAGWRSAKRGFEDGALGAGSS